MAAGDLTTLDSVEAWLDLQAGNSDEALLASLISAASTFAESWCDRQFALQPYTEVHDGNGNIKMPFSNKPVVSISSLMIGGCSVPAGDAISTPGYYFTPGRLMLNGYRFTRGMGNVVISLEAGFTSTPLDVSQAVNEIVGYAYKERIRLGMSSQAIAGETTSYVIRDMPPRAATILQNYKKVAPT